MKLLEINGSATQIMRHKYRRILDSAGRMRYPAGGSDIYNLCSKLDMAISALEDISHKISTEDQNILATILWRLKTWEDK